MYDFIAQLVEHRTGIAEVTGSNPVEALFFQASSFQVGKFTAMIILHFHLQPLYKYELFHIYFTISVNFIHQQINHIDFISLVLTSFGFCDKPIKRSCRTKAKSFLH